MTSNVLGITLTHAQLAKLATVSKAGDVRDVAVFAESYADTVLYRLTFVDGTFSSRVRLDSMGNVGTVEA